MPCTLSDGKWSINHNVLSLMSWIGVTWFICVSYCARHPPVMYTINFNVDHWKTFSVESEKTKGTKNIVFFLRRRCNLQSYLLLHVGLPFSMFDSYLVRGVLACVCVRVSCVSVLTFCFPRRWLAQKKNCYRPRRLSWVMKYTEKTASTQGALLTVWPNSPPLPGGDGSGITDGGDVTCWWCRRCCWGWCWWCYDSILLLVSVACS